MLPIDLIYFVENILNYYLSFSVIEIVDQISIASRRGRCQKVVQNGATISSIEDMLKPEGSNDQHKHES